MKFTREGVQARLDVGDVHAETREGLCRVVGTTPSYVLCKHDDGSITLVSYRNIRSLTHEEVSA